LTWPRKTILVKHGKGDKQRASIFGPGAVNAITGYLRQRTGLRRASQIKEWMTSHPDAPMWVSTKSGKPLSYVQAAKIVTSLGEKAGVGHIHMHQTRRLFMHNARAQGMLESALRTLAGWTGASIPKTYAADTETARAATIGLEYLKKKRSPSRRNAPDLAPGRSLVD
jgi:site-specific recombinase XerD